jgi:hypothetical protein
LKVQVIFQTDGDKRDSARLNYLNDLLSTHMDKFTVVSFLEFMPKWVVISIDNEVMSAAPLELYTFSMFFSGNRVVYEAG